VHRAVAGSDIVVNCTGILHGDFNAIHAQGPGLIGRVAASAGVARLVHLSAIGARTDAPSQYAATKGDGERSLREAFPAATILRPSLVFGPEDNLFNRFAGMARMLPFMPVICGDTKFQPVYVGDVANAVMAGLARSDAVGSVYELGGPRVWSMREMLAYVLKETGRSGHRMINISTGVMRFKAAFLERLPSPPITRDQLIMLEQDNVVGDNMPGLAALDIVPTPVELVVPGYLRRFQPGGGRRRVLPDEQAGGVTDLSYQTRD
jgi:uncharacterized protein YbjT (DUF2867 family)